MLDLIENSVKMKIALSITLIFIVVVVTMAYAIFRITKPTLLAQKKDQFKEATVSEAQNISSKLDQISYIIGLLADDPNIIAYTAGKSVSQDINGQLKNYASKGLIRDIGIANTNGAVTVASNNNLVGQNYKDQLFFQKAISGERSSVPVIDFQKQEVKIYTFSAIKTKEGKTTGAIFGLVDSDALYSGLLTTTLHGVGDLAVVDGDGMVLYTTDKNDFLASFWALFESEKEDIKKKYGAPEAKIEALGHDITKDSVKNYSGPQVFDFFDQKDNVQEILTVAKAGTYPLFLSTDTSTKEVTAAAVRGSTNLAGIWVVLLTLATLAISRILSHFLKPLKTLKKTAKSIRKGNLDQEIHINTTDEFRDVGDIIEALTKAVKNKKV